MMEIMKKMIDAPQVLPKDLTRIGNRVCLATEYYFTFKRFLVFKQKPTFFAQYYTRSGAHIQDSY